MFVYLRYAEREVQSQSGHWQERVLRPPDGLCICEAGTGSPAQSSVQFSDLRFRSALTPAPLEVLLCEHWAKQPGEAWDCRNSNHLLGSQTLQITCRILFVVVCKALALELLVH